MHIEIRKNGNKPPEPLVVTMVTGLLDARSCSSCRRLLTYLKANIIHKTVNISYNCLNYKQLSKMKIQTCAINESLTGLGFEGDLSSVLSILNTYKKRQSQNFNQQMILNRKQVTSKQRHFLP